MREEMLVPQHKVVFLPGKAGAQNEAGPEYAPPLPSSQALIRQNSGISDRKCNQDVGPPS